MNPAAEPLASPADGGPPSKAPLLQAAGTVAVVILGGLFVWANRGEIPAAWRSVRHADLVFLGLALACTALWLLNLALFHLAAYRAVGLDLPFRDMVWLTAGSSFVNMVAKSGGMGGMALFIQDAGRRRQSRGRVITSYLLAGQLGHLAYGLTLVAALAVVWADGQLTTADVVASIVFAGYALGQAAVFVAGVRSRTALRGLHELPARVKVRILGWLGRPQPPHQSDHEAADELYEAIRLVVRQPSGALVPAVHALLVEVLGIATIWAVLAAFGERTGVQVPLVAYAVSVLFSIIGFLPAGLGFAEASLGATFTSYGIAGPTAAVAVITYRLFEVWIPFAVGGFAAQRLARRKAPK